MSDSGIKTNLNHVILVLDLVSMMIIRATLIQANIVSVRLENIFVTGIILQRNYYDYDQILNVQATSKIAIPFFNALNEYLELVAIKLDVTTINSTAALIINKNSSTIQRECTVRAALAESILETYYTNGTPSNFTYTDSKNIRCSVLAFDDFSKNKKDNNSKSSNTNCNNNQKNSNDSGNNNSNMIITMILRTKPFSQSKFNKSEKSGDFLSTMSCPESLNMHETNKLDARFKAGDREMSVGNGCDLIENYSIVALIALNHNLHQDSRAVITVATNDHAVRDNDANGETRMNHHQISDETNKIQAITTNHTNIQVIIDFIWVINDTIDLNLTLFITKFDLSVFNQVAAAKFENNFTSLQW